jgi:uncharacterized protein YcbK (DUF882 family)
MTSVATALNQLLASNFSEVGRASGYVPFRVPQVNPNAVQAPDASDNTELQDRQQQSQQQALVQQRSQERQQNLRDFAKPQVRLLPSDEVQLFARAALENSSALSPVPVQSAQLSEETNRARRAVLNENSRESLHETLQARAQQSVAHLYARNANAVYNTEPLFFEAA